MLIINQVLPYLVLKLQLHHPAQIARLTDWLTETHKAFDLTETYKRTPALIDIVEDLYSEVTYHEETVLMIEAGVHEYKGNA